MTVAQSNDIEGVWFSEIDMRINSREEFDLSDRKNPVTSDEISIDTFYTNIAFFMEIYPDGTFESFTGKEGNGNWKITNDTIKFVIDSLSFQGVIEKEKLILFETDHLNGGYVVMRKVSNLDNPYWSSNDFENKYMTVVLNDSITRGFHFFQDKLVLINWLFKNKHRIINRGQWELFKYKNYLVLIILNREEIETYQYLILRNDSSNLYGQTTTISPLGKSYKTLDKLKIQGEKLLKTSEIESKKLKLAGEWQSINDFYPADNIFDGEILTSIYLKINFKADKFSVQYGGKGKDGNYEKSIKGDWKFSKTGKYIEISYINKIGERSFETTDYIAINELFDDKLELTMSLRALKINSARFKGIDIKLKKIK